MHVMTIGERRRGMRAHARLGKFHGLMILNGPQGFDSTLSRLFRSERFRLGLMLWGNDYRDVWGMRQANRYG